MKILAALLLLPALGLAGNPVTCELIGTYDIARLNKVLTTELAEFSDYPAKMPTATNAVRLYRIVYPSVVPEQNNRPTKASGLLAIPDGAPGKLPVVSYQHGTVFSKTEVPSHPDESMETRLMLAAFAGRGYVVVAADYFGKGESPETDAYLVKASAQQACYDMLTSARAASADLKVEWGDLFLTGWSQGGWTTMVFLNRLEEAAVPVKAASTASAPNDLFAAINHWIHSPSDNDASFIPGLLALQLPAYERYYGLSGLADAAIVPDCQTAARDLYLNNKTWAEAGLPKTLARFLQEPFAAESSLAGNAYWKILRENQAYQWRSVTPLRIYYGEVDEVVPPAIAMLPAAYQKTVGGAQTTAIEVEGKLATHRGTFVHAVAEQAKWFDELILSPKK